MTLRHGRSRPRSDSSLPVVLDPYGTIPLCIRLDTRVPARSVCVESSSNPALSVPSLGTCIYAPAPLHSLIQAIRVCIFHPYPSIAFVLHCPVDRGSIFSSTVLVLIITMNSTRIHSSSSLPSFRGHHKRNCSHLSYLVTSISL